MISKSELLRYGVALVSDGLDSLRIPSRVVAPGLQLLNPGAAGRFCGPAKTLCFKAKPPGEPLTPLSVEKTAELLRSVEALVGEGDVVVVGFEGPVSHGAILGGLYGRLYANQRAAGFLSSGYIRDLEELIALGLPAMARGTSPVNGRGRILLVGTAITVKVGEVDISVGDTVLCDRDGAIVLSAADLANEQLEAWLRKTAEAERRTAEALKSGLKLSEAYQKFGAL